jgi:hypothetical protein
MNESNEKAGPVTVNDLNPAVIEHWIALIFKTFGKRKHYTWLLACSLLIILVSTLVPHFLSVIGREIVIASRPEKGAEITSPKAGNVPQEFDIEGNLWGLRESEKPQLEIRSQEGYYYRDIVPLPGERFKREKAHLGSIEHNGKKDPDAGKYFDLQIVIIPRNVIPNRHRLLEPIPCERISKVVTYRRLPISSHL